MFVLTRRYPGLAAFEQIEDVPVYRIPTLGPKAIASLIYTSASMRQLARIKPDIIHAYSLFSPLTTAVAYKGLSGVPVVTKILRGGQLGDVIRLKKKFLGDLRINIFRRNVDAFITISQEINAELEGLNIDVCKRPYIPNGVDTEHFSPVPLHTKQNIKTMLGLPDGPLVVYTGRLVAEKRVDLLLQAWSNVDDTAKRGTLIIVGTGNQEAWLHSQARERVIFTGGVENVLPYLQCADLFVLPSSTEGLSNSLLEAMSTGLPVIATAVGGAPDVIDHKVNGWLIPPNDIQAIQNAITNLLSDPDLRYQLAQSARQTIIERFALSVVARQLRKLYDEVL